MPWIPGYRGVVGPGSEESCCHPMNGGNLGLPASAKSCLAYWLHFMHSDIFLEPVRFFKPGKWSWDKMVGTEAREKEAHLQPPWADGKSHMANPSNPKGPGALTWSACRHRMNPQRYFVCVYVVGAELGFELRALPLLVRPCTKSHTQNLEVPSWSLDFMRAARRISAEPPVCIGEGDCCRFLI